MKRSARVMMAIGFMLPLAVTAAAQTKTITGEMKTETATVEAIEKSTRTLTLKGPKGNYVDVVVPKDVTRFEQIKVGDKLTAKYYENVVLRLKAPGEKDVDTGTAGLTRTDSTKPGGTAAAQRTITATITAIDQSVPTISFSGPNNWTYTSRVQDKKALEKVKVGDRLDITWTEALLVSFGPPTP